jgi:Tol biopolymer transport system component
MGTAALVAVVVALCAAATAQATYPGENGDIAYVRFEFRPNVMSDLYLASPTGADERLISRDPGNTFQMLDPSFSGDGRLITWEGRTKMGVTKVLIANSDGSAQRELPLRGGIDPALSPDGSRIAYELSAFDLGAPPEGLYVSNLDASGRVALGNFADPDFSPNGSTIAAIDHRHDGRSTDIFAIPADGGAPVRLTNTPTAYESKPSWSPDGEWIAYTRHEPLDPNQSFPFEVWVMRADGTNQHRVVSNGNHPVWSPDGQQMLFQREPGLWRMDADGSDAALLVTDAALPAWQPRPRTNRKPVCSGVRVAPRVLWPANRRLRPVRLIGGSDPDGDVVTVEVAWVGQDEPLRGRGDRTAPDAFWTANPRVALLRAERSPRGDGRVYWVDFWVTDEHGARCGGTVEVTVPRHRNRPAVESPFYESSILLPGESNAAARARRNRLHR